MLENTTIEHSNYHFYHHGDYMNLLTKTINIEETWGDKHKCPNEIQSLIFSYCSLDSLKNCLTVNKYWSLIAQEYIFKHPDYCGYHYCIKCLSLKKIYSLPKQVKKVLDSPFPFDTNFTISESCGIIRMRAGETINSLISNLGNFSQDQRAKELAEIILNCNFSPSIPKDCFYAEKSYWLVYSKKIVIERSDSLSDINRKVEEVNKAGFVIPTAIELIHMHCSHFLSTGAFLYDGQPTRSSSVHLVPLSVDFINNSMSVAYDPDYGKKCAHTAILRFEDEELDFDELKFIKNNERKKKRINNMLLAEENSNSKKENKNCIIS